MSGSQIDAKEEFVHKLFGEDYLYQIPQFQRPFSWTEENFVDLIDDLIDAYSTNTERYGCLLKDNGSFYQHRKENYEPYFLGSIILNRGTDTGKRYDIIDGQQRLTSISILLCVLRDRIEHEGWASSLDDFVQEEENFAKGIEGQVRLRIRDRDQPFFEDNVLNRGATIDVRDPQDGNTEPEENILQAVKTFVERLSEWEGDSNDLESLAAFLAQRVIMVRITTDSLSSAFRLFNVTNARGMPLNNADLLKSENLSYINKDERDEYQHKWEDMEEEVGNEGLERFIGYMRHILVKERSRKSIYDEFSEVFVEKPEYRGKNFVDELEQVFDIHRERVYSAELNSSEVSKNVYYHNLVTVMRDFYPSDEWVVSLIEFDKQFEDEELLYEFTKRIERRLTVDWLTGSSHSDRYTRVYRILRKMERSEHAEDVVNSDLLKSSADDRGSFENALNLRNFYRKGNYQWPKYILMRLNMERYDNRNVKIQYGENINVEHILPRNPATGYWTQRFSDELEREKWTNRLGNLVLLDGRKNYKASNRPFPKKYETYFAEKQNDFAITNELSRHDSWTPTKLKSRHKQLVGECIDIWIEPIAEPTVS
ncbi:DUF262 domain-containing protein [Salinigranum halophilum]|uniref:DUF262 domain-containing protein n=1 Tax=Salinigranum halophilum TaxID=2565931 RepID=UPI0010A8D8E7|nr:DUF262 domain-containing protein [Salinigranum halophilum]